MVIDYKGVSFSFKDIRKSKRLKRFKLLILFVIIALVAIAAIYFVEAGKIEDIQALMLEGKQHEASAHFKKIESSFIRFFHKNDKKELKSLLLLFSNDFKPAEKILASMKGRSTSIDSRKFLDYFSDNAQYRRMQIYVDFLAKFDKEEYLLFYRALYKTALLDFKQSMEAVKRMSHEFKKSKEKELARIDKVNTQLAAGKVNYIFDVNGKSLAYYDMGQKKTVSLVPGITFDEFNGEFLSSMKFFHLTFDRGIQEKIHTLFRDFKGSFILFNVSDSSIAAAYSKPADPMVSNSNIVFSGSFEPGSIIKILTMFASLKSSNPMTFPIQCSGLWVINDSIFRDWTTHNQVNSYDEALAVSCNLAFAKMGVTLGFNALKDVLKMFYFNSDKLTDLFLGFKTGTFNDKISSDFQLANLSVGLTEISITTFHAGLISDIISQNGSIYTPYLIKSKKNILDIGYYNHNARLLPIFSDNAVFNKIKNAMIHVLEHPNGTGRRAKVDFFKVALKTGTSGDKEGGLDAVLTGFFPAEKPKYAFAFRLEGAGKAEWKGAQFLKDFLFAVRYAGAK